MSLIFGEMRQVAFVVRDLDRALEYWTRSLGVGPFYLIRDFVPEAYTYRGKPSPPPKITLALGFSGEFQVEIIQPHDDHPSAYRDSLLAGREGFHHVSSWVTRAEYDVQKERILASGITPAHEGTIGGIDVRFIYFATETSPGGLIFEMAEVKEPPLWDAMMNVREEAKRWNGKDPIRDFVM